MAKEKVKHLSGVFWACRRFNRDLLGLAHTQDRGWRCYRKGIRCFFEV